MKLLLNNSPFMCSTYRVPRVEFLERRQIKITITIDNFLESGKYCSSHMLFFINKIEYPRIYVVFHVLFNLTHFKIDTEVFELYQGMASTAYFI